MVLFASFERLGTVDSTNAYLATRAAEGAPEGSAVVAEHQSAGRGRLGRGWLDVPGGSVLCSVLFRPPFGPERYFLLAWLLALSAAGAIETATGVEVGLKWPNDLEVASKKVAGVLGEAVPPDGLVVGIGINCNWPGPQGDQPVRGPAGGDGLPETAAWLSRAADKAVDREAVTRKMLSNCVFGYGELLDGGEDALVSSYRRRLTTIGRVVRVDLARESFTGRAADVDGSGRLLVESAGSIHSIDAADVVHLRAPPGPPGPPAGS
ncbi:MAG: biotin--[acetyl-CoA-carboxylase] ligase [Acidimicrobiales bacterium]